MKRVGFCFILSGVLSSGLADSLPGPLLTGLGDLAHPVTTQSQGAQSYFNQGIRLLFGFNHKEAIRSFRSAAYLDPNCAMAYWGVAYAYGPHVNKPMDTNDTANAWEALTLAVEKKSHGNPREQAYITALESRYQREHNADRMALDKGFANAMRVLVQKYPDDMDAQTLFAESLMNTMPWDYWTRDRTPKPETEEILSALKLVLTRNPDHPGANHFYIHAIEAGPSPELGIASADRLLNYAPAAGHLVHMPAHIYMRVGQYEDAINSNQRAVQADRDYIRQCRAMGFYPGAYYPHNMHFLWWAHVFQGHRDEAMAIARQAAEYAKENYCGPSKAVEAPRLRHLPWLTLTRFGQWDEVLALPEPATTNDFLVDRALWHFTRGVALTAKSDLDSAEREKSALTTIVSSEDAKKLSSPVFPVTDTLTVALHFLSGKIAGAKGQTEEMLAALEKAMIAEEGIPYMEPSYWPLPIRTSYGVALLRSGNSVKAEQVLREDLKRWPRNGWTLFALEKALREQGKSESADLVGREFQRAWKNTVVQPRLDWF